MDRKLRECLTGLGISADEAYRVVELMKAVLARTSPEAPEGPEGASIDTDAPAIAPHGGDGGRYLPYRTGASPLPLAEALVLENYHTEDFRRLLGVNLFEDTVWFNKEAFEEALFYGSLFLTLEGEEALEAVRRPPRRDPEAGPADAKEGKGAKAAVSRKRAGQRPSGSLKPWPLWVEHVAALTDQFRRAEAASGYKLESLIEALSGADKPLAADPPADPPPKGKRGRSQP